MTTTYPRIEKMMAGYINMDAYEIAGSSELNDQVAYFTSRVSPKALRALVEELDRFEREHAESLTEDFEAAFDFGANIQDARQFFDLVRDNVGVKLGDNPSKEVEGPSSAESEYQWILDSVKHGTSYNVISNSALHQFAKKLDELSHNECIYSLSTVNIKGKWLQGRKFGCEINSDSSDASDPYQVMINVYENALVRQAADTPHSKRLTEQYVQLLETILTFKGVTVGQYTSKPVFGLSVDDFIRMQERKFTL